MELKRSHLAIGGAVVLVAAGLAASLLWHRPAASGGGGVIGKAKRVYGADTPEGVIEGVYAACKAGDLDGATLLYLHGPELNDPTLMQKWCGHALQNGKVKAWEIDKTLTKTDPAGGLNMMTATWLDDAKTEKGPYIQWWLMQDGKRWVMFGGL